MAEAFPHLFERMQASDNPELTDEVAAAAAADEAAEEAAEEALVAGSGLPILEGDYQPADPYYNEFYHQWGAYAACCRALCS